MNRQPRLQFPNESLSLVKAIEIYENVVRGGSRLLNYYRLNAVGSEPGFSCLIYETWGEQFCTISIDGVRETYERKSGFSRPPLPDELLTRDFLVYDAQIERKSFLRGDFGKRNRSVDMFDNKIRVRARTLGEIRTMQIAINEILKK